MNNLHVTTSAKKRIGEICKTPFELNQRQLNHLLKEAYSGCKFSAKQYMTITKNLEAEIKRKGGLPKFSDEELK